MEHVNTVDAEPSRCLHGPSDLNVTIIVLSKESHRTDIGISSGSSETTLHPS